MRRRDFLTVAGSALVAPALGARQRSTERHLLYVATPGIRNYESYGGIGVLVFDPAANYKFVRRIPTWKVSDGQEADNVKGIAANARTGRLFVSTIKRLLSVDLSTDRIVWDVAVDGGCDRLAVSPDGRILYVPSFEGPHWTVMDAMTGQPITKIVLNSGAHNTIYSRTGRRVYMEGLRSPVLSIADPRTHTVVKTVGPFAASIRPFTVNGAETLCYVNVNDLLGFEIGDIATGKKLHRVEIQGFSRGPVDRHGCPSHGVGLTRDESELWVADGHNKAMHVFDNTVMPPKQKTTIFLRDQPGWITFSLDGRHAYPSTGEIIDVKTKQPVAGLTDEVGRRVSSEKLVEVVFTGNAVTRVGDQFGVGAKV